MNAGSTPNLARTSRGVAHLSAPAIHLHDAIAHDALREILVGRPDADLLDARIGGREMRRRGQRVVGLELDHRPRDDAHGDERLFERVKLRPQRGLDAFARFVAGPQIVAERLDDVIGGNADVRDAAFEHLHDRPEHSGDGSEGLVGLLRRKP